MSKKILGYAIGVMVGLFVWVPWVVPDSWTYIKKAESEYLPMWHTWALFSIFLLFFFAFAGIIWMAESINDWITKPTTKE